MLHVFTIIPAHASMKCRCYKVVLPVHSSTLFLILKWLPVNGSTLFLLAGACQWHLQFVYKRCSNNDARKQIDERWDFQQMDFDSLICTACTWQHLLSYSELIACKWQHLLFATEMFACKWQHLISDGSCLYGSSMLYLAGFSCWIKKTMRVHTWMDKHNREEFEDLCHDHMFHVCTIFQAHASVKSRFYKVVLSVHGSTFFLLLRCLPVNGSTLFLTAGACIWHHVVSGRFQLLNKKRCVCTHEWINIIGKSLRKT